MKGRKQREEQRIKDRKEVLKRLKAGSVTPEEKVHLYLLGEFFFVDVFELRCSREEAEAASRIDNDGLVELDGRLWYVDPNFDKNLAKLRGVEKRQAAKRARRQRSGSVRRRK